MNDKESTPEFLTVRQFCEKEPAFTHGGMRFLLFNRGEELESAGVIVRFGTKILIDKAKFIEWLRAGGAKSLTGTR